MSGAEAGSRTPAPAFNLSDLPLGLSVATRACCFSALGFLCQLYLKELGASRFQISLSTTLAWTAITLFSRFWGVLSDVFWVRRRVILLAAIGSTLMTLVLVSSSSVAGVLVGRFLVEAFGSGLPPAAIALLSERGPAASRGRWISIFTTSQSIGFLSGALLGGFLSSNLVFYTAFLIMTGVSAVTVVASVFMPGGGRRPDASAQDWRSVATKLVPSFHAVTGNSSLIEYGLPHLYGGVVLRKAGVVGIYGLLMVYLRKSLDFTAFAAGSLSAINPASQALFMPLWGRASDAFGRKRVFVAGYFLTLLVPLLIMFSSSVGLLVISFFVLGVGFAAFISGVTAYIGDVAPDDRQGELMGLLKVSQGTGGIVGPLIAGVISSPSVAGYNGMFVAMFSLILAGLILTIARTRDTRP